MSRIWNLLFGWEEVIATPQIDQYMKLKAELENRGITTRSEFVNTNHSGMGAE